MDVISNQENINILPSQKRKWFKKPLFFILAFLVIVLGYFTYQFGTAYNTIVIGSQNGDLGSDDNGKYPMPSQEDNRLDVLILGIRGGTQQEIEQEGGLLTDTIQIISVDKKTNKAAIVSIPRDLYVEMMGVKGKINEYYERGLAKNNGLEFAKTAISKITGVYIDKAIVFDFNAFQHIVDTIGGIDITLSKPFIESSQWGYEFNLPIGKNHLDGQSALYYVRSRYSTSDFDRARRQQQVVTAIKTKASAEGYLTNPIKITNMMNQIKGDVKTDFQIWDVNDLTKIASHFTSDSQIKDYVIDTTNLVYEAKGVDGAYILLPKGDNYDGIKNFFQSILKEVSTPTP